MTAVGSRAWSAFSAARERFERLPGPVRVAIGLALITAFSLQLRSHALNSKLWIDEGLSAGIASHPFFDIPGALRRDGSPPLYYLLLHVWTAIVGGDGEVRLHTLSLLFALLLVPAGYWAGSTLFDRRTGWVVAALAAVNPFMTYYAQEARMYSLVALLGLLSITTFALVYAQRRRAAIPWFAVSTALMLYTHNWGLFFGVGMFLTLALLVFRAAGRDRRPLLRDGLLGFGGAALLYLPWLPTLIYQARHTGAPWSKPPRFDDIINSLQTLGGGATIAFAGTAVAFAGITTLWRRSTTVASTGDDPGGLRAAALRDTVIAILVAGLSAMALAWLSSQLSPAWASRYFAVFVGPVLLFFGIGLVRYGVLGFVVLAMVLFISADPRESDLRGKGDAWRVATALKQDFRNVPRTGSRALVRPGDIVLNTHPEHVPVVRYYFDLRFPDTAVRWYDAMGPVPDTRLFDWRDAEDRLRAAGPRRTIRTIVTPALRPGQHLVLMVPILRPARWNAPWTRLVKRRSLQWRNALNVDPNYRHVQTVPKFRPRGRPKGVRAIVYERVERPRAG